MSASHLQSLSGCNPVINSAGQHCLTFAPVRRSEAERCQALQQSTDLQGLAAGEPLYAEQLRLRCEACKAHREHASGPSDPSPRKIADTSSADQIGAAIAAALTSPKQAQEDWVTDAASYKEFLEGGQEKVEYTGRKDDPAPLWVQWVDHTFNSERVPPNIPKTEVYNLFRTSLASVPPSPLQLEPQAHFSAWLRDKVTGHCEPSTLMDRSGTVDDALGLIEEFRREEMPKVWPVTETEAQLIRDLAKVRPRVPDQLEADLEKRLALLKEIEVATMSSESLTHFNRSWLVLDSTEEFLTNYVDELERLITQQAKKYQETSLDVHRVGRLHIRHWVPLRIGIFELWTHAGPEDKPLVYVPECQEV